MSVHLRQLQLLVFEQNWGCAQGLQQRLASSTATPAESKQWPTGAQTFYYAIISTRSKSINLSLTKQYLNVLS